MEYEGPVEEGVQTALPNVHISPLHPLYSWWIPPFAQTCVP